MNRRELMAVAIGTVTVAALPSPAISASVPTVVARQWWTVNSITPMSIYFLGGKRETVDIVVPRLMYREFYSDGTNSNDIDVTHRTHA